MLNRSLQFANRDGGRYAWCRLTNFVPPLYSFLNDEEWAIIESWYDETEKEQLLGECNVAFMSVLQGFVMGSAISNIIQLGHFAGYSTLLLGFMLRRMKKKHSLMTVDISEHCCNYTQMWIDRAGLGDYVRVELGDSANATMVEKALKLFGASPRLVLIDSSHQFEQTLHELRLWYPSVERGGFIFLHDSGPYAKSFDSTNKGGVSRAMEEWLVSYRDARAINIYPPEDSYAKPIYMDPCGIGIIQKD